MTDGERPLRSGSRSFKWPHWLGEIDRCFRCREPESPPGRRVDDPSALRLGLLRERSSSAHQCALSTMADASRRCKVSVLVEVRRYKVDALIERLQVIHCAKSRAARRPCRCALTSLWQTRGVVVHPRSFLVRPATSRPALFQLRRWRMKPCFGSAHRNNWPPGASDSLTPRPRRAPRTASTYSCRLSCARRRCASIESHWRAVESLATRLSSPEALPLLHRPAHARPQALPAFPRHGSAERS